MSVTDGAPIRRSPLADRHRARGARFVDAGEWPATYGDLEQERRAVRQAVALCDEGPFDRISTARRPGAALPATTGRVTDTVVDGRRAWWWGLNEDEALLLAAGRDPGSAASLCAALDADGLAATDVSSRWASLELAGPRARDVLEAIYRDDIGEDAAPDRSIVFGPLANVAVTIARIDRAGSPAYRILVERDLAEYLWDALLEAGAPFGIRPVGADALAEN